MIGEPHIWLRFLDGSVLQMPTRQYRRLPVCLAFLCVPYFSAGALIKAERSRG